MAFGFAAAAYNLMRLPKTLRHDQADADDRRQVARNRHEARGTT
jgi:hypothetical protein